MSLPVVLLDLDEVLFPWAFAYRGFRARRDLPPIPPQAWRNYAIGEDTIVGHQDLMASFHNDAATQAVGLVPGREHDCLELAKTFSLVACTSRYEVTEGPGTRAWVQRWAPWLNGVHFCNWHPESGRASGKGRVAEELRAVALVDDTPVHLEGLPAGTVGLLVERPAGVPSASGALPWDQVVTRLRELA